MFKTLHFGLNIESNLAEVEMEERHIAYCNIFSSKL